MNNINIFEIASKNKFRYFYKGVITTEDLWDLSLAQLDTVYKALNAEVKKIQEDSLLDARSVDAETKAKIDIVKYIFAVKQKEAEDRVITAEKAAKKQRIMEILAKKQANALENMSEDELQAMLNDMD